MPALNLRGCVLNRQMPGLKQKCVQIFDQNRFSLREW